ncbi:MAG: DUF2933 domain-containing protein [Gemmatimonadetes bacterium]|nr:DUF2933 domain-containing protein [Gemmatimonadota bacterium]
MGRPSRATLALLGFLVIAGFLLTTEHRAHLFGILPFLLLLACPLIHLFMHGGHGNGAHNHADDSTLERHDEHAGHRASKDDVR